MTCRVEDGQTYLQTFNIENRISGIALVTGNCDTPGALSKTWLYTYDGDGIKVKQLYTDSGGSTTTYYYAGGSYEVQSNGTTSTTRQYYSLAGINMGMREGSTFNYFLTDHQGSVVGVTDAAGALISETRYMPFGQVRTNVGTITQTDYGYTFQQRINSTGLMDYDARMYDAGLGRFIQADTLVNGATASQAYDRYGYVSNNPINFIDPTGHKYCDNEDPSDCSRFSSSIEDVARKFHIYFSGNWDTIHKSAVVEAV